MYVITGATGNTGSVISRSLLASGKKVRAVARHVDRLQSVAALGAEPFPADVTDPGALARAFAGAQAVYLVIPPNFSTNDLRAFQNRVAASFASALEKTGVPHVVMLSSVGADKPGGTGPVIGLHILEELLNRIPRLNALKLRAAYFMENTFAQAGIIQQTGVAGGPLSPDLRLPMIATRDIGAAAAEALLKLDFSGQQTRELLGQRDLTMSEAAAIIGNAIGRPGLTYAQFPDEQLRPAMANLGMTPDFIDLIFEMSQGLNSGHMRALETRSVKNTTPTSYETFVKEEFAPLFAKPASAN